MTVTNLGALASNVPVLNGLCQVKRGGADTMQNAVVNGGLYDGVGGDMRITFTPTAFCAWIVKANVIAHGLSDGVGWRRWDLGINITPADANGYVQGFYSPSQVYDMSTVEWRTMNAQAMFLLDPGVAYTAYLVTTSVSGGTVQYHTGPQWLRLVGRVAAEGWV